MHYYIETKRVKKKVKVLNWKTLIHAAYTPDPAPYDYHLFLVIGYAFAMRHFVSYENVKKWLDDWFALKNKYFFWEDIHKLPER